MFKNKTGKGFANTLNYKNWKRSQQKTKEQF
jgi:hypothetical protein